MVHADHAAAQAVASPGLQPRPAPPEGFEDFYRDSLREVVKAAMHAGATLEEAQDAASQAFLEMLGKWPVPGYPLAYARRAAITNFIKAKVRGPGRVAARLVERGHVHAHEGAVDDRFTACEGEEWVAAVLGRLSPAQREVMRLIADGLDRDEIAGQLRISEEAVRRRVCDARGRLAEALNPDGEPRQPGPSTAPSSREEDP